MTRHPVLTTIAGLVVLGLAVKFWWLLVGAAAVAAVVVLVARERRARHQRRLDLAQTIAAHQQVWWSYLSPADRQWMREQQR